MNTNLPNTPGEENNLNQTAEEVLETAETAAEAVDTEAAEVEAKTADERKKKFWKEVREWIVSLAVALVIVLICQNFLFTLIRVDGGSMNPTLLNGERLFVTVADVKFGEVDRDIVVICHYPNRGRTFFVKRVVGIPGDTVYRINGVTYVAHTAEGGDGQVVSLDPLAARAYGASSDYEPYVLGEDEYFVVGDNRYNSHDSRDWNDSNPSGDVGPISKDMIVGRVRQVIWPLSEIRPVK